MENSYTLFQREKQASDTKVNRLDSSNIFFTNVHSMQGPIVTQGRELMNEMCNINIKV